MKKALSVALVALFASLLAACSTLAPWKSVPSGQQSEYGRIVTGRSVIQFISFSDDPGISVLAVQSKSYRSSHRYAILLDGHAREELRAACEKFEKWRDLARANETEITRTIVTLDVTQMYEAEREWHDAGGREISLVFTSRVDSGGNQKITLTLKPSPVFMFRSLFMVYGRDFLVLDEDQAAQFSDLIQEDAVDSGYQKAKKRQDVIDMFN